MLSKAADSKLRGAQRSTKLGRLVKCAQTLAHHRKLGRISAEGNLENSRTLSGGLRMPRRDWLTGIIMQFDATQPPGIWCFLA